MKTPAQTILEQLGGNRFIAMTGAKQFVSGKTEAGADFLQFSIGRGANHGINKVRVTLTIQDLYWIEFYKLRGVDCKRIMSTDGVCADRLAGVFTEKTGFDTRL